MLKSRLYHLCVDIMLYKKSDTRFISEPDFSERLTRFERVHIVISSPKYADTFYGNSHKAIHDAIRTKYPQFTDCEFAIVLMFEETPNDE